MSLFTEHSIIVDIPKDKAQAVLNKITGEYGKLIRENYDLKPFTGEVTDRKFRLIPNLSTASIKIKGDLESDGMGSTKINVKGHFLLGKLILFVFTAFAIAGFLGVISVTVLITESVILGALTIFFPTLIVVMLYYLIIGTAKSQYNDSVHQLIRKMDLHEYVL